MHLRWTLFISNDTSIRLTITTTMILVHHNFHHHNVIQGPQWTPLWELWPAVKLQPGKCTTDNQCFVNNNCNKGIKNPRLHWHLFNTHMKKEEKGRKTQFVFLFLLGVSRVVLSTPQHWCCDLKNVPGNHRRVGCEASRDMCLKLPRWVILRLLYFSKHSNFPRQFFSLFLSSFFTFHLGVLYIACATLDSCSLKSKPLFILGEKKRKVFCYLFHSCDFFEYFFLSKRGKPINKYHYLHTQRKQSQ